MNQRYASSPVVTNGQPEPAFEKDRELYYAPATWPGARLLHVWVFERSGRKVSTLDLCGRGEFFSLEARRYPADASHLDLGAMLGRMSDMTSAG